MISINQIKYLKKIKKEKILIRFIQIFIIITTITLWQILSSKGIINSFIYSSPIKIIETINNLIINNNLLIHIITTLKEIIIAFTIGTTLGFIIAIIFYEIPFNEPRRNAKPLRW